MGVLTLYTQHIEKGIFIVAVQEDAGRENKTTWEASSNLKKYDDQYELVLNLKDGKTGKSREGKSKRSVAQYFDENGVLLMDLLEPEVTKLHNSLLSSRKIKWISE